MSRGKRREWRPVVEGLEDRRLLAAPITDFPIPAAARGIASGPDGNIWFTLVDDQIGRMTPTGQVHVFPIPPSTSGPSQITLGPDGSFWFTYLSDDQIGRITPDGHVTVFPMPETNQGEVPHDIVTGPDGNLWFTEPGAARVGRLTPAGQVTLFTVSSPPQVIKVGGDGSLWFTESERTRSLIGRMTPAGELTEFPLRGVLSSGGAIGPDGNLWFTMNVTTPIPDYPGHFTIDPYLTSLTPSGQLSEHLISGFPRTATGAFYPAGFTFGPDGNFWYADFAANLVRRFTPTGFTRAFSLPAAGSAPDSIIAGPDGNLWFSEGNASQIGRFRVSTTDLGVTVAGSIGPPFTYTATVTNHGPLAATDVVLTSASGPISGSSVFPSRGTVRTGVGGGFLVELGDLESGATATITIVVSSYQSPSDGTRLTVHANESDAQRANDTAILTPTIAAGFPSGPPRVVGLQSIRDRRKGLTAVVVRFDQPLAPDRIQRLGIYQLDVIPKAKKARPKMVRLRSATYDAASQTVQLTLKKPVKTGVLRLTIYDSGGFTVAGHGLVGGNYVARLPR